MWLVLSAATPPTLTGTIHSDHLSFEQVYGGRIRLPQSLALSLISESNPVFYQPENNIFEVANTKPCYLLDFSLSPIPPSLRSVQERRNVVSLLTWTETDCPFFLVFIHRNSLWETPWETCGVLGYNQTQEPQYPDSATTTTDSCGDSVLSKKH